MEKGEIRFHGPTAELLERPDVLRSVFLEGARHGMTGADATRRPRPTATCQPVDRPAVDGRRSTAATTTDEHRRRTRAATGPTTRRDRDPARARRRVASASVASPRSPTCRSTAHAGEIVGFIGPNGAGKTTLFDVDLRLRRRPTGARSSSAKATDAVDVTRLAARRRARGSGSAARSRTAACSRRSPSRRRSRSRSSDISRCATRSARRLHLPSVSDAEARRRRRTSSELLELLGITDFRDKLVRELSTGSRRIVDLACVLAHGPVGAAARRAVVGHRAARSRSARPAAAAHPRADGRDAARDRARRAAAARASPTGSSRSTSARSSRAAARRRRARSASSCSSYLGTTEAAIARSGTR